MKALYPFETSGASYPLARRHNPQERSCPPHRIKASQGTRRYAVTHLVEALRYKPEGRGSTPDGGNWNFTLT